MVNNINGNLNLYNYSNINRNKLCVHLTGSCNIFSKERNEIITNVFTITKICAVLFYLTCTYNDDKLSQT